MRLALEKSSARFNFAFFVGMCKGGKAPKEAFARDDSRAFFLKNAPTYIQRIVIQQIFVMKKKAATQGQQPQFETV